MIVIEHIRVCIIYGYTYHTIINGPSSTSTQYFKYTGSLIYESISEPVVVIEVAYLQYTNKLINININIPYIISQKKISLGCFSKTKTEISIVKDCVIYPHENIAKNPSDNSDNIIRKNKIKENKV